ncbi:MAG: hypothetical protein AB7G68_21405 [Nitrospiraceae bacterium]
MKGIWWPGLLSALLAGCVAIGSPELADEKAMDRITVGETTKADIVTFLGPPPERRSIEIGHATRESWSYSYASATINPLEYLLLYGLWTNGIGLFDTRYDLFLSFDYKGVVSGLSLLKTSYDMGSPVRSTHVTAVADNTIGVAGPTGRTVRFVDKVDYRAE